MMRWVGFCTDEELIRATLLMLEWQRTEGRKNDCRFHVHDTKEMDGAWTESVEWIVNEYFPLAYEAGLRYNISILSPDLFSKLSSEALYLRDNSVVPTKLCETLPEAERFILEVKNSERGA
ncbi:hypothetical protein [Larkinella soli]|uniref:hypothetical protein n=1 Tax=Larkinella soli TaxID=1770527 RepID=UPI001E65C6C4|nr:hypothetical protein [Larkinella soli]